MRRNLLIVGAGAYSYVVYEIAIEAGLFEKIDFVDDGKAFAPNGSAVVGKINEMREISHSYTDFIVAIGNSEIRLELIERISRDTELSLCSLISPKAYISPSAALASGVIVEPMAVVQSDAMIGKGCLICSGAVIKHNAVVEDGCYIDCNFVVASGEVVLTKTKKTLI